MNAAKSGVERRRPRSGHELAPVAVEQLSAGELMERLEVLHNRFEDRPIDFDTFEDQKRELLEQLASIPLD